jgi:hypothetical protein
MSRKQNAGAPPSLAQHFDAPDDYIGTFGWLCGYSADAPFLDDAAERFTRLIGSRRAYQGRIVLAAMLDPGNPAITLLDAPGVAHLPIKDVVNKPFRLLHAKVALLGFRHQENHDRWLLRLLVSTGNWTQQTLEKNLDLAWRIDASSESLINPDSNTRLDCADIKAAWNLLEWIQEYFDLRLLNTSIADRTAEAAQAFDQVQRWIATCEKNAQGRPRFFDSRKYSLLQQLPEKIQTDKATRRNYLALGSGFYETSKKPERAPEVPMAILERLRDEKLLTENADIDLYINPKSCQAIESSFEPLDEAGFTIRPSATPATVFGELSQRDLHAKFLFSCNCREDSASCSSPWVYLGSGNLTHAGFVNKMNPAGGNLEAGVVFSPGALFWYGNRTTSSDQVITNLLPIQRDHAIEDAASLSMGSKREEREACFVAAPIAWLEWRVLEHGFELCTDDQGHDAIEVLDSNGKACPRTNTGFQWCEAQPREVAVRWQANGHAHEIRIPVVDQYGRLCATALPAIDINEAWWQLADFPMPPDDDTADGYGVDDPPGGTEATNGSTTPIASYPIRQMMELVESIAAKQTAIDETNWPLWCNRLEQTLRQTGDSAVVKYFREVLGLNPLSPLHQPSFRPSYAESNDTAPGKTYFDALTRVEESWKVNGLNPLGGMA